ncbi:hypothetical protein PpBr36_08589 [Pyricularia pennisetigena]|uniref:hypothetical protein n=1 Tax=Pyricularia pennisetigena TaxID=1578925 RepID=UPI00114F854F|nr:hypothetical protein PpBr36_08589 [Pyricularia pennisetigena]TLS24048.1 hypothetical protein PpBr36_08589 [Pyricularia pennisetigena]
MAQWKSSIVTCDPPLGSATILKEKDATFTVGVPALELEHGGVINGVCIWHNYGETWSELPLREHKTRLVSSDQQDRRLFRGSMPRLPEKSNFRFTLRLETDTNRTLWIKDLQGIEDGEVFFQSAGFPSRDVGHYLEGITESGFTASIVGQKDKIADCMVWNLAAPIPPAQGPESGRTSRRLGKPDCALWFATVRHNLNWFGPRQGADFMQLDKEAVLVSFLRRDGFHVVLLPVCGLDNCITTLVTDHEGALVATSRNEEEEHDGQARMLVSVAVDFEQALSSVMAEAKRMASSKLHNGNGHQNGHSQNGGPKHSLTKVAAPLDDWNDGFAYCTWNSLGQDLSQDKILGALTRLSESGVNITNLIIDDNWQSLDGDRSDASRRRWERFEANQEGFPHGLKGLISEIRKQNPHIRNIAMWHGIFGYWGGMSPSGEIAGKYKMRKIQLRDEAEVQPKDFDFYTVDGKDVYRMYDDFYSFLADCGVSAAKVDTQGFLDYPAHAQDRKNLIRPYQDAWTAAADKHFGGRAIACMAQTPQSILHSLVQQGPKEGPKLMARNSDDFFPDEVESHTWHVFCNAHNALLMRHLGVLLDWDMFQTTTPKYAALHAAARSMSGGPIYITDAPGDHDLQLIKQMTAQTADGRTIALRSDEAGRTLWPYGGHGAQRLLRVRSGHQDVGMLGVFNVCNRGSLLGEQVRLADFFDGQKASEGNFVISRFSTGEMIAPADQETVIEIGLEEGGFELFTAYPITKLGGLAVATLGLVGKMASAAALSRVSYSEYLGDHGPAGVEMSVSLKALGTLGIFARSSNLEDTRTVAVKSIVAMDKPVSNPHTFSSTGSQGEIRLDLESLSIELGLDSCYRDESTVDLAIVLQFEEDITRSDGSVVETSSPEAAVAWRWWRCTIL